MLPLILAVIASAARVEDRPELAFMGLLCGESISLTRGGGGVSVSGQNTKIALKIKGQGQMLKL